MVSQTGEHKTRDMIFNHILAHPGVSFSIIKSVFAIPDGTLRYHLNFLEGKNEIRSGFEGKNKCYYPSKNLIFDTRPESSLKHSRLNQVQERLLDTIHRYPGITQKDLIYRTNISRLTIGNNIKKLLDYGVIRKEPNGRSVQYYHISEIELRKKAIRKLVEKFLNYEIDERTFLALKRKLE